MFAHGTQAPVARRGQAEVQGHAENNLTGQEEVAERRWPRRPPRSDLRRGDGGLDVATSRGVEECALPFRPPGQAVGPTWATGSLWGQVREPVRGLAWGQV